MWKNSDLRKLLSWAIKFFEEDSGKPSMKRILSAILGFTLCKVIFRSVDMINAKTLDVTDACFLLGTIFSFIAVLLGMTYIPTRKDNTVQKS